MPRSILRAEQLTAVLVDLDDTLLDETAHMRGAYGRALDELRHQLPPDRVPSVVRNYEAIVGDLSRRNAWDDLTREQRWGLALQRASIEPGDLPRKICQGYYRHYYEGVDLLPGAERLLDAMAHVKTCLITNGKSEYQWGKVRQTGVEAKLDHILVSGDLGISKPDARIFERALDLTGAQPSESVMIGDSLHADIAAAGALGIGTIWINRHDRSLDEATYQPDAIVTNPGEAARLIEGIAGR